MLSYLTRNTLGRLTNNYKVFNNENDTTAESKINDELKKKNKLEQEKHYIYYTKKELFDIINSCNIDEKYKHIDIWEKIHDFIQLLLVQKKSLILSAEHFLIFHWLYSRQKQYLLS